MYNLEAARDDWVAILKEADPARANWTSRVSPCAAMELALQRCLGGAAGSCLPNRGCLILGIGDVAGSDFLKAWLRAFGLPADGQSTAGAQQLCLPSRLLIPPSPKSSRLNLVVAPAAELLHADATPSPSTTGLLAAHDAATVLLLVDAARAVAPRPADQRMLCWAWMRNPLFAALPLDAVRTISRHLPPGLLDDECAALTPLLTSIGARHGPCFQATVVLVNLDGLLAELAERDDDQQSRLLHALCGASFESVQDEKVRGGRSVSRTSSFKDMEALGGGGASAIQPTPAPLLSTMGAARQRTPAISLTRVFGAMVTSMRLKMQAAVEGAATRVLEAAAASASRAGGDGSMYMAASPPTYVFIAPELPLHMLSERRRARVVRALDREVRHAAEADASGAARLSDHGNHLGARTSSPENLCHRTAEKGVASPLAPVPPVRPPSTLRQHQHEPLSLVAWLRGRAQFAWFSRRAFFEDLGHVIEHGRCPFGGAWIERTPPEARRELPRRVGSWSEANGHAVPNTPDEAWAAEA